MTVRRLAPSSAAVLMVPGLLLGLLLGLLVGVSAPANAELTVARDRSKDTVEGASGSGKFKVFRGDLRKIRVNHGISTVKTTVISVQTDYVLLYVDTDEADPGPEYALPLSSEYPVPDVYAVDDFSRDRVVGADDGYFDDRTCRLGARIVKKRGAYDGFRVDIPRRCLGNPERVRMSAQTAQDFPGTTNDWGPGERRFGPWTRSGPI